MKKKELHQVFASLTKVADATNKTNWQLMSIDNLAGDIIINIAGLINQKIAHICQSLKNLSLVPHSNIIDTLLADSQSP